MIKIAREIEKCTKEKKIKNGVMQKEGADSKQGGVVIKTRPYY